MLKIDGKLIEVIRSMSLEYFDFLIYQDLPKIPPFNPDEMDSLPSSVRRCLLTPFRR